MRSSWETVATTSSFIRVELAEPVVLLHQGLGDLALDGQEALALGLELLALGDVGGHDDVAGRRRRRRRPSGQWSRPCTAAGPVLADR